MKNLRWLLIGTLMMGTFVLWQVANELEGDVSIDLLGVESLAFGEELPEVGITCGSPENRGRCWDGECETTWTPFGWYKAWNCNRATGNTSDFCSDGVPC
ncbi:hypothetical protein [Phocaeicola sp.]|uniref:hypothetical protein n=1 Tax=Phocaeicola sp. TaxID=2773926 RepID=UPI0023C2D248|nr:hypothetical protein [Phocaeicola sp.]MDE5678093.1 hypothetical protein [Phocaeicola sp.]